MRVSHVRIVTTEDSCQLQAEISSSALTTPFVLWYRFPADVSAFIAADSGNPWVAALLLPAMWVGEPLEVDVPISPKLATSLKQIQAIYRARFHPLSPVTVTAPLGRHSPRVGSGVALFFSGGVDSWYSLLKHEAESALSDPITHLIVIHGADMPIDSQARMGTFATTVANTRLVGERFGKQVLSVATNIRFLYSRLGIAWHLGSSLPSTALVLEGFFKKFNIAATFTYADIAETPCSHSNRPSGTHPLLDPLWATESSRFVHDGCERTRLEKIKFISGSEIALDMLRVCWNNNQPEYNCGRCGKCLRTMVGLHIAGALGKCRTLPSSIDIAALRRTFLGMPYEVRSFEGLVSELGDSQTDTEIRSALTETLGRSKAYFTQVDEAQRSLETVAQKHQSFILVDEEAIRDRLADPRKATPFLERNGVYDGPPKDSDHAITEVERLRVAGATLIAFWRGAFWWLEYYEGLNRHLRSTYSCVLENENLIAFDLTNVTRPNDECGVQTV